MRLGTIVVLRVGLALLAACVVAGCAPGDRPPLPPPPVHADGGVLWRIVHDRCLPDQIEHGVPAPCAEVALQGGGARGYAVLKDRDGVAQYLVMPTSLISGIEDGRLLAPDATNYFAAAWRARHFVEERLGKALPREDMSIAVNSLYGRSQDLLHLHVDCLRSDVREALGVAAARTGRGWSRQPVTIAGHSYRITRIDTDDLDRVNPFRRLADGLRVQPADMGGWTLVLTGATFAGRPGFLLLAARADMAHGEKASGEVLQDHACTGRTRS